MSHTVTLNRSHWKTIKAIWRQTAHPFVLIIRSPGLSSFRRARHWDVFGIIFLMLQQPVQQKTTTDYSQRASWLSSIYCDTLLYFNPPFLPLLFFLLQPPPPRHTHTYTHLLPFLSSHLLPPFLHPPLSPPFSDAFLVLYWNENGWKTKATSYVLRRFAYKDCVALCCVCVLPHEWGWRCIVCVPVVCVCLSVCSRKFRN